MLINLWISNISRCQVQTNLQSNGLRCQLSGPRTKVDNLSPREAQHCFEEAAKNVGMVAEIPTRSVWCIWMILVSITLDQQRNCTNYT